LCIRDLCFIIALMQAVVLMAGKGTRWAKHYQGPKQLMPINGKPIVEYILDVLPPKITELIFVVGGPHEQTIRDHFSRRQYAGRPITFVVQQEQLGLAHAYQTAKHLIDDRWFGVVGDDVYGPGDLNKLFGFQLSVMAYRVDQPESFGVLVTDKEGYLAYAVEKPREFVSNLVNAGAMIMDQSFMETEVGPSYRGEYEVPDVWTKMIREQGKKIKVVEANLWLPVNEKAQLEEAERVLAGKQ
jgi:UDP-N-acetylglucosamine diphosphorylase / glucose-1-phosphate thymidylyltransferase / UDP-N-acetylgalactosamine diphosphorylase / glucosamine-1-phosphate N-acetyltransferase / galactosamine-1-phosphate N-acetyltransferase